MIKSKSWNWKTAKHIWWEEPAAEVYPLLSRWQKLGYTSFLDLGCGIGRHSILFAKNGFSVSAFDLGKEGLKTLSNWVRKEKFNVDIKQGDMLNLPYKNSSFDCLIAFHVIFHTDDEGILKVVGEIKRVLKTGGEAFITFNSKESSAFKSEDVKRISDNTLIITKGHEKGIPHYYADKREVENLLKDFEIKEFSYKEEYYPDYTGAHYFILVKK